MQKLLEINAVFIGFSVFFFVASAVQYGSLNSHFYSDVRGIHSMNSTFAYENEKNNTYNNSGLEYFCRVKDMICMYILTQAIDFQCA